MAHYFTLSRSSGQLDVFASVRAAAIATLGEHFGEKSDRACRIAIKRWAANCGIEVSEVLPAVQTVQHCIQQELVDEVAYIRANGY